MQLLCNGDAVRARIVAAIGNPAGVLVADMTGFITGANGPPGSRASTPASGLWTKHPLLAGRQVL